MGRFSLKSVLGALGQIRGRELTTALLMFSCSFLAMTTHNIIKPVTRSKFIADLGASNLPYVQLAAGLLIGLIMAGYTWLMSRLPRRWAIPITQAGISAVLVAFWFLVFGAVMLLALGLPKDRAAPILLQAVADHWQAQPAGSLREVHVTLIDEPTLRVFATEFEARWPGSSLPA